MQALNELITAAVQLAGADDLASHNARLWQMEGGRACPLGWGGCSQPVYVDVKTGAYDYGEPGGPGHADCVRNCKHGMQQQPEDDELPIWQVLDDEDWEETPNAIAQGREHSERPAGAEG